MISKLFCDLMNIAIFTILILMIWRGSEIY